MKFLVFDSGIGGLGVVEQMRKIQPRASIIYLADNGFFPYGEKPDDILLPHIVKLIGQAIDFIKPDAVVIACNTASTIALSTLRAAYDTQFVGCVPPVKPAAAASHTRHIGLLATPATIRRPYLQNLIDEFAAGCTVHSLGTPALAELSEQKFRGHAIDLQTLRHVVAPLFAQSGASRIDAVALGCTHYTFLLPEFLALYPGISWFDPALPVARQSFAVTRGGLNSTDEDTALFTSPLPDTAMMQFKLMAYGFASLQITRW